MITQAVNKVGTFEVSFLAMADWQNLTPLFEGVVVIRAEARYDKMLIEYTAYCEKFEEIPFGEDPPAYAPRPTIRDGEAVLAWEKLP